MKACGLIVTQPQEGSGIVSSPGAAFSGHLAAQEKCMVCDVPRAGAHTQEPLLRWWMVGLAFSPLGRRMTPKGSQCSLVATAHPVGKIVQWSAPTHQRCVCLWPGLCHPSLGVTPGHSSITATTGVAVQVWPLNLVDPASSHMLLSRTKPCKCQSTWIQQWVCEWLLTPAVISVIECG